MRQGEQPGQAPQQQRDGQGNRNLQDQPNQYPQGKSGGGTAPPFPVPPGAQQRSPVSEQYVACRPPDRGAHQQPPGLPSDRAGPRARYGQPQRQDQRDTREVDQAHPHTIRSTPRAVQKITRMEQPECSPAIPATARAARAGGPTARVALTARHPSAMSARARLTGVAWRWGGQGPWSRGQAPARGLRGVTEITCAATVRSEAPTAPARAESWRWGCDSAPTEASEVRGCPWRPARSRRPTETALPGSPVSSSPRARTNASQCQPDSSQAVRLGTSALKVARL